MRLVILAGGASRRMGQDKALLPLADGTPFLQHLVAVATSAGCSPVISGRAAANSPVPDLPHLPDDAPGQGPLAGLAACLDHWQEPLLLIACDMPLIQPTMIAWLRDQESGMHGMVPQTDDGLQPCCACYLPAVRDLVRQRLAEGRRSLHGFIAAGDFTTPAVPAELAPQCTNINTPDELENLT